MEQQNQIRIKAIDEDLKGRYANLVQITSVKEEFLLDFLLLSPFQGMLVSRVLMSPGHAKRMAKVLQEQVDKYESSFRKIEEAEAPESKIGFGV